MTARASDAALALSLTFSHRLLITTICEGGPVSKVLNGMHALHVHRTAKMGHALNMLYLKDSDAINQRASHCQNILTPSVGVSRE